jgi:hypothetical protein
VIRICYEDFSAGTHDVTGWHGKTVRGARGVTLYLLPGLTAGQRRAVIRRLRQEASRGFGPPLPVPQLAIALGLDRLRAAAGTSRAIVRLHPLAALLPGAFAVAVLALFVIASSDGPGTMPKTRVGLADAVSGGGGNAVLALAHASGMAPRVRLRCGSPGARPGRESAWGQAVPGLAWVSLPGGARPHGPCRRIPPTCRARGT